MANPVILFQDIDSGETGPGALDVRGSRSAAGIITFDNKDDVTPAPTFIIDTANRRLGHVMSGTLSVLFDYHYQKQAGNGDYVFDIYSDNGGENFEFQGRRARGSIAVPTALADDDDMWEFGAYGHNGTSFTGQCAAILFEAAGAFTLTSQGTRQVYKTTENGTTVLSEVLVLGDDGCVVVCGQTNGFIGAVAGEYLRVVGATRGQGTIGVFANSTDTQPQSQLINGSVVLGVGGATAPDVRWRRVSAGLSVYDNNTAKRVFIVDVTNERIGGTSIDDTFTPTFDLDFEKEGAILSFALTTYGERSSVFGRRANGTKGTPTGVVNNDILFRLTGDGWDTAAFQVGAAIDFQSAETWSGTVRGERIVFQTTAAGGTTLSEKWRIEHNGNFIMNGNLSVLPTTDSNGLFGTAALRFSDMVSNLFRVFGAASDANPTAQLSTGAVILGAGGASALDSRFRRAGASLMIMDNNGTSRTWIVDASNRRVGFTTVDDTFTPLFHSHFEHQTTDLNIVYDNYGNNLNLIGRRSGGSKAAPTDVGANLDLFLWGARGWEGGAFSGDQATLELETTQAWSAGAHGTRFAVRVTANGSTTLTERLRVDQDGSVQANVSLGIMNAIGDTNFNNVLTSQSIAMGAGGGSALDVRMRRTAASTFTFDDNSTGGATLVPAVTNTGVIGTNSLKWNRVRATSVVSGHLGFDDPTCIKCGQDFSVGEDIILRVVEKEPGINLSVPIHARC